MTEIECPYCRLGVHPEAVVCPHCRSPLGLLAPLVRRVAELEAEVSRLQNLMPRGPAEPDAAAEEPPKPGSVNSLSPLSPGRLSGAVIGSVGCILVLHYLLLFVYDLPPVALRLATLAAPAMIATLVLRSHSFGTVSLGWAGALVALASVLGMLGITSVLDQVPFWPTARVEWRELGEYTAAIALGFAAGGLMARALEVATGLRKTPPLLVLLLKRDESGRWNVEHLADRINQVVTSVAPVATGALGLYSGLRALLT